MIMLLIALFYHAALGLQLIIEDYVHAGTKFATVIVVWLVCVVLAVVGILAALRIASGSADDLTRCSIPKRVPSSNPGFKRQ